jgi:hypothetical protein
LYDGFPVVKGVSSQALDPEVFAATLIMAIVQTYPRGQQPDPYKCLFFVRGQAHHWALEQLGLLAKKMFGVQKERKRADIARHLGAFLRAISMGSRVLQFKEAPDRWVAFGFNESDQVPAWMQSALIEGEP